jgi:hypothetical protein
MPGFAPAAEILFFREKDPKPMTPRQAISHRTDANLLGASQLAALKQGPRHDTSVRPEGYPAGVGQGGIEASGNSMLDGKALQA